VVECITKGDDKQAVEHSLVILQQYFGSLGYERKTQPKLRASVFEPLCPQLVRFINESSFLSFSIKILDGLVQVARVPFQTTILIPLLPKILSFARKENDHHLNLAIVHLLQAISSSHGFNPKVLLSEDMIAFLQHVDGPISALADPILSALYSLHDSTLSEARRNQKLPVLANFLYKNGIPTCKYYIALLKGNAVGKLLHDINDYSKNIKEDQIHALFRLSFFGAEEIVARPGMINVLLNQTAKEHPLVATNIAWMITLPKRSRRKITEADRAILRKFVAEFDVLSASKQMQHMKNAIMFNLDSPGTFSYFFI
jgi:hypothetical protein